MTSDELAWLAGYLEGEGSFRMSGSRCGGTPQVRVSAVDLDVVERAGRLMGGTLECSKRLTVTGKPVYSVGVYGDTALVLMALLLPNMGERRAAKIRETIERANKRLGQPRGERAGGAKLTQAKVCDIRRMVAAGGVQRKVAAEYGVCPATINHIVSGKIWKHTLTGASD